MNLQLENKTAADFFHHAAGSLLRRFATPDEVAAMVAHVAPARFRDKRLDAVEGSVP